MKISASIVIYNHSYEQLKELIDSFLKLPYSIKLLIVDNSLEDGFRKEIPENELIDYVFNDSNLGYGRAHNIALRKISDWSDYHIVLNPDILFETQAIVRITEFMNQSENVALLMPKVLYGNGENQYLCKRFPTPFDLIMRRFIPGFLKSRFKDRMDKYELKHKNYNEQMEVPNLSGCFMFMRMKMINTVGYFDERFFMYLEDTDLCRRINMQFQTVYFPEVSIIHQYEKGSYKSNKLLGYHIMSAFRYFNKYGWFFDTVRTTINGTLG